MKTDKSCNSLKRISFLGKRRLPLILFSILLLTSCSKSEDCSNAKKFSPLTFSELKATSVVVSGYVVPKACAELNYNFSSGVFYGLSPNLNRTSGEMAGESLSLSFDLLLENLQPGTTYYIRPYFFMNLGGGSGPIQEFTTLPAE